jgi:hypothetical protein
MRGSGRAGPRPRPPRARAPQEVRFDPDGLQGGDLAAQVELGVPVPAEALDSKREPQRTAKDSPCRRGPVITLQWQGDEPNPIPDMKRPAERIYCSQSHGLASVQRQAVQLRGTIGVHPTRCNQLPRSRPDQRVRWCRRRSPPTTPRLGGSPVARPARRAAHRGTLACCTRPTWCRRPPPRSAP